MFKMKESFEIKNELDNFQNPGQSKISNSTFDHINFDDFIL